MINYAACVSLHACRIGRVVNIDHMLRLKMKSNVNPSFRLMHCDNS
jgi:hypothetical protein